MKTPDIWAYLIHLGSNMWADKDAAIRGYWGEEGLALHRDYLLCEDETWDKVVAFLATQGINMLLIDVGEGYAYESHPELAVKGSWDRAKLQRKLQELRDLGIEPIPKLNFSACHDIWLKDYSLLVGTETYRRVAADLIAEVCDVFGKPRFFHLGMDEENPNNQASWGIAIIRNETVWWSDFYYLVEQVEKNGSRAWVWSDYYWHYPEIFKKRMPKEVLQSNWYYEPSFSRDDKGNYTIPVQTYLDLDAMGYDQIPTASTWDFVRNPQRTCLFCRDNLSEEHLLGYMTAPWQFTCSVMEYLLKADAAALADARRQAYGE
ncbi:MAG: hypothetical protein IJC94_07915 [Oscillospiraceae bacterium]|nr:hypothetical protein [Oscillospiraceae bacterium]MBQ9938232.1 hypothetical protein [Oscillospiraceae bacterium]